MSAQGAQRCPEIDWCDVGERSHRVHERTLVTVPAVRIGDGEERGMMVQVIVTGTSTETARLVLAMVDDQLGQWSAAVSWADAARLNAALQTVTNR